MKGTTLSKKEIEEILELGKQNLGCSEIAAITGYCSQTISNVAKRNNVLFKNMRASFNTSFFNKIDTQEQAYVLGLIYSDGYLLTKRRQNESGSFGIAITDREILEKVKIAMSSNHRINEYKSNDFYGLTQGTTKPYYRIIFTSDEAYNALLSYGLSPNKTYNLKFPSLEQLPQHLQRHFIRGLYDGDGSISRYCDNTNTGHMKYTITFTGTKEICNGIQEFFGSEIKLAQRYPERNVNNYTLAYCGNISIKNKLDILYEDASIYLERKFKLWEELNEFLNKH